MGSKSNILVMKFLKGNKEALLVFLFGGIHHQKKP